MLVHAHARRGDRGIHDLALPRLDHAQPFADPFLRLGLERGPVRHRNLGLAQNVGAEPDDVVFRAACILTNAGPLSPS